MKIMEFVMILRKHQQNHDCKESKCYVDAKGITITAEQLEKLVSDLGSGMVSIKSTEDDEFTEDSGFKDNDGNIESSLLGEGKVLRLKLINNTDM